MPRLFDEHIKRRAYTLDGAWKMQKDEGDVGKALGYERGLPSPVTVAVPSVWNTSLDMLEYEGVVYYEKNFYSEGGTLRFSFGAVMTEAEVYLDGEKLGYHYGGFCRFSMIKTNVEAGMHRLSVRVDNRFDKKSIPAALVDWYHYGGITRSVEVEELKGITVLSNKIDYTLSGTDADCRFRVELYNAECTPITDTLCVRIGEKTLISESVALAAHEKRELTFSASISEIELWSQENPTLYFLTSETSTDDLRDRIGFRTVEVKNRAIFLNGKKILLRGVNRHEDHPDFGMALPHQIMQRDLEIIENMNCNTIRGSHYPNNPLFIDMLDEEGILFWSEIPIWGVGFSAEAIADPVVIERGLNMHREMVNEYYNHPSIFLWGMHNELTSTGDEVINISRLYYNYLKENGGNRLVTFASCKRMTETCFDFCDVVSLNLYVDWYDYNEFSNWNDALETMENYLQNVGAGDKPVIMSEFGAAAIYGHHTFDNLRWTEEYQAKLVTDCIKLYFDREEYAGCYIWQFCDIRTSKEMGLNRARSFNNKGLVNEYRRPKLAYGEVRKLYEIIKKEKG